MTLEMDEAIRCVSTGGAVVINVRGDRDGMPGLFTHGGHYVILINVEPDGRLAIMDPYLYDGKFDEEGRAGKVELKNGVIALCTPEILAEEVVGKKRPFHMFWRK